LLALLTRNVVYGVMLWLLAMMCAPAAWADDDAFDDALPLHADEQPSAGWDPRLNDTSSAPVSDPWGLSSAGSYSWDHNARREQLARAEPPQGYRVKENPRKGMIGAGAAVFAGLYTATITGMVAADAFNILFAVPIAGPLVMAHHGGVAWMTNPIYALALLDGLGQLAGSITMIVGVSTRQTERVVASEESAPAITLSPGGAGLVWRF
jgi:hypothetical protein